MNQKSERLLAVEILESLLSEQGSLSSLLSSLARSQPDANLSLVREFTYGTCRWYPRLAFFLGSLLDKPPRKKDRDIHCLLLLGLYQLYYMRIPDHAVINETVSVARQLKKPWAGGLVNGVLRNAQRRRQELETEASMQVSAHYAHPAWFIELLQRDWPDDWQFILESNNSQAPMTLRLDTHKLDRQQYLEILTAANMPARPGKATDTAVILENPLAVEALPGFAEGQVSVQDEASQLAASLLDPPPGAKVLDACCAPGGKTCALLEHRQGNLDLLALDNSEERLSRVHENLARLGLQARVSCADATDTQAWWDGTLFDCILLDAPCSGTGVIRRHPDIKLLRHAQDIDRLVALQKQLLAALWPCLRQGGRLLYSTCSVLPAENSHQVEAFMASQPDARLVGLSHPLSRSMPAGMQFLPGKEAMDGFFYALLEKS